ncbi:hypothetical protein D0Y65_013154, partial [Glycine soja]
MRMSFPLFTLILLSTLRKGKHCADFLAKMNPSTGTWFMEVVNPPLGMHQLILPHVMGLPFIRFGEGERNATNDDNVLVFVLVAIL